MALDAKEVASQKVRYRGVFSFPKLLQDLRTWFSENDMDFEEPKNKYKVGATGVEQEIEFKGTRKITEYTKHEVNVYVHAWDMKDVEIVRNGDKVKMNDGKIYVEMSGKLQMDWQKRFDNSPFLEALRKFYHNHVIKRVIEDVWEDAVLQKILSLLTLVKKNLAFEEYRA